MSNLVIFARVPLLHAHRYHCWRLIGYHLGILDEFNVCASMPELERCLGDYMEWTPARLRTCRASTHELQHAVCDAFGVNTGMGVFWRSSTHAHRPYHNRFCIFAHYLPLDLSVHVFDFSATIFLPHLQARSGTGASCVNWSEQETGT